MAFTSLGDLALTAQLRTQVPQTKAAIARLGQEVTTSETARPGEKLRGDYSGIAAIERSLATLEAFNASSDEVEHMLSRMQTTLTRAREDASELTTRLFSAANSSQRDQASVAGVQARQGLDALVSSLNARLAGQALFAGAATDRAALVPAEELRELLADVADGEDTADAVAAALDDWFGPGGGFETEGYVGSDLARAPSRVGPEEAIDVDVKADHPAIRQTLKGFAMAALLSDGVFDDDVVEAAALADHAAETLSGAHYGLVDLQSGIGTSEARLEAAQTRNAAEATALADARKDLVGIDQYEAATRLEAKRLQLEMLHTLTARLSRLSLAEQL